MKGEYKTMELAFYSVYEQMNEDHYEKFFYTIGTPLKPFEEVKAEAYEEFFLLSSEGENADQWDIYRSKLKQYGYHEVKTKDTAYIREVSSDGIRSCLKPFPRRRYDGTYVFEESETLQKVNEIRIRYGKTPLTLEAVEELLLQVEKAEFEPPEDEIPYEYDDYEPTIIINKTENTPNPPKYPTDKNDFSMDDFDQFLTSKDN